LAQPSRESTGISERSQCENLIAERTLSSLFAAVA
jgi:hypothetical protein